MADRSTYSPLSDPPPTGLQFLEQYSDRIGQLFAASALPLASAGGTGDAVTAVLDPDPGPAGLLDGMKFSITWAAANTGGMTLSINGGSPVPVLDPAGAALAAGAVSAGLRTSLEYIGGAFQNASSWSQHCESPIRCATGRALRGATGFEKCFLAVARPPVAAFYRALIANRPQGPGSGKRPWNDRQASCGHQAGPPNVP